MKSSNFVANIFIEMEAYLKENIEALSQTILVVAKVLKPKR